MGILTALAAFLLGPWGISLIAIGVAGSFMAASVHLIPPRSGIVSLACGVAAFVGAYIVRTYVMA
jgi:hypothetical protein